MNNDNKGARSPDVRGVSQGVYPTQSIKSKVVESDDVSSNLVAIFFGVYFNNC